MLGSTEVVELYRVGMPLDCLIVLFNNMEKLETSSNSVKYSWDSRRTTWMFFFKTWVYCTISVGTFHSV